MEAREEVTIIGAGPAGLCVARELAVRGVNPLLLERGGGPGASWQEMAKNLKLGPWSTCVLPGQTSKMIDSVRPAPALDFHRYLVRYAEENDVRVRSRSKVSRVTRTVWGFDVEVGDDVIPTTVLVNATGYFSNPWSPKIPGAAETSIPQIHSAQYLDPESTDRIRRGRSPILIVGSGLSAGELVRDLYSRGQLELSHRSPLRFGRSLLVQRAAGPLYFSIENARVRLEPNKRGSSTRPMDGGKIRRLIRDGRIVTRPEIHSFDSGEVRFLDGSCSPYSLVIYATGYRPHVSHLEGLVSMDHASGRPDLSGFESVGTPNLFFIGLDNVRNFRSRLLRGIREDASLLATQIQRRLTLQSSQGGT